MGRDAAGTEARPRHDAWLHGTSATPTAVEVRYNETPRHSWQAELTLGPTDRIIIDGRSAAHAIEQLLTVLPAALAARHLSEEGPIMLSIKALHPSGFEILLQVPSLEEIDATITDLLRRGYRPAGPSSPDWILATPRLEATEEATAAPQGYADSAGRTHEHPNACPPRHDLRDAGAACSRWEANNIRVMRPQGS